MSTATPQNVNPFAAPMVHVAEAVSRQSPAKRASVGALKFVSYVTIVANIVYPMMVAGFFLMLPFASHALVEVALGVYGLCFLASWFTTIVLAVACRRIGVGLFSLFLFPVPFLGTLMFLVVLLSAKEFMLKNGYMPCLLGFVPDPEERQITGADPFYVPNAKVRKDGTKRGNVYMLSECVFILSIVGFVVSFVLAG